MLRGRERPYGTFSRPSYLFLAPPPQPLVATRKRCKNEHEQSTSIHSFFHRKRLPLRSLFPKATPPPPLTLMNNRALTCMATLLLAFFSAAYAAEQGPSTDNDEPHQDTITIAVTGDILMGTTYPTERLPQDDGRQLFVDAAPILTTADIAAGNLEGTLSSGGQTEKKLSSNSYAFRTPPAYAGRLADAATTSSAWPTTTPTTSVTRESCLPSKHSTP